MSDAIGVDLGGTKLLLVCGEAEARHETGPDFTPAELEGDLRAFIGAHSLRPSHIGIAIPGLVDAEGRVVAVDSPKTFDGWSAREALDDLACRVVVVNDVNAALAEELHDAPGDITAAVVMAGTSIGAAFVADGRPLLGASGYAGELGYLPLLVGQDVRRLDEVAGGAAIAARLGVSPARVSELAHSGDAAALEAIREGGHALGLGLAAVINLLNPSAIALGGGTSELPGYFEAAVAAAERFALPDLWRACTVRRVRSGARAAALGAMRLARR